MRQPARHRQLCHNLGGRSIEIRDARALRFYVGKGEMIE